MLSTIDSAIIVVYFLALFAVGFSFAKRDSSASDYFLAGRSLGWIIIGFSLFASNISSSTLVGLSGAAYQTGISIFNYEWMASVVLVFFCIYFVPYYLSSKIFTVPEFLERRYTEACRYYFSALTIVANIFIDTAGTLYAGSLVVQFFFPDVALWQSALVLAIAAGIYTSAGGLAAVVYTDVVQAIVLLVGSCILSVLALEHVGSWSSVVAKTPPEYLSLIRPIDDPTMPWLGTLIGVPILGFYFWCTNQFIVQRVLGARDVHHARWGCLFAGLLKLVVLYIMVFPGILARQMYPELPRADLVYPTMLNDLLPVGFKGLVLAGLFAAIMSSVDSTLNSASTLVTMDFVKKRYADISSVRLAQIGRVVTLVFMIVAVLWVPVVSSFDTLFHYLQSALAYLFPPVVAIVVLGFFSKRIPRKAGLYSLLIGHGVSLSVFVLQNTTELIPNVHFLILSGGFFLVSVLAIVFLTLLEGGVASEGVEDVVYSKERSRKLEFSRDTFSWWQDYRVHSVILLLLTAWVVWIYR